MSSPNILLTRIDNRLVHGQVGVTWTSTIGANLLVVVDDVVANDDIQQKLMGITAETYGFGIRFFTIEKTINVIGKAAPHQKIFLICRTPQTVRKLVEGGIDLKMSTSAICISRKGKSKSAVKFMSMTRISRTYVLLNNVA